MFPILSGLNERSIPCKGNISVYLIVTFIVYKGWFESQCPLLVKGGFILKS